MRHSLEFAATRNLVQDPRARRGRRAPGYASHCVGQYLGSVSINISLSATSRNTGFSPPHAIRSHVGLLVLPVLWVLGPNVVAKAEQASVVASLFQALGMRCGWCRLVWRKQ